MKFKGEPGDVSDMHAHPDIVAVGIASGKAEFTMGDGQKMEAELNVGDAMFMPAHEHSTKIVSDSPMEVVLIELK